MRHDSVGLVSNAHSAKTKSLDRKMQVYLQIPVLLVFARILWPPILRFPHTTEIVPASRAALPRGKVCITKTLSCTLKVNISLGYSHTVMFNTFQDFSDDETL